MCTCWVPCQRADDFAATVLPLQGWRLRRPSPRSSYAYTPSGASPAESAHAPKRFVPLSAAKSPAHGTFWPWGLQSSPSSIAPGGSVCPPAPSAADPRRVASSRNTAPCPARASARLTRTGRPPPPCARSSASPSDPDPAICGVSLFAPFARSRLRRNRLARLPAVCEVESGEWKV